MKKALMLGAALLCMAHGISTVDSTGLMWEKIPAEAKAPVKVQREYKVREFTQRDAQILMRIAEAEAGNQHTEGMKKIMEVVLNRVNSPNFPNSIEDVVFQYGVTKSGKKINQFSSVGDGRYYDVEISPQAHEALALIERGEPIDEKIIAFEVNNGNNTLLQYFDYSYTVGCHNFYVEKEGN